MAWYSKLFSSVGVSLASTIGNVLDELITSDEEVALTENQRLKIQTAYELKMRALLNDLDQRQAEHEENLEAQLTERLKLDMKSDSWLSKNIRPMALIFMTAAVVILAFYTVFDSQLSTTQITAMESWIPFFSTILLTIYGFYFGSRGLEKIQKIRSHGTLSVEKEKRKSVLNNLEPKG